MNFFSIPTDTVAAVWPRVEPMLAAACRRGRGDTTTADLLAQCSDGLARLVLVVDDEGLITLAGVLQLVREGGTGPLACIVRAAAGSQLRDWVHLEPELEAWARHHKADTLSTIGRLGWRRHLEPLGFTCTPLPELAGMALFAKPLPPTAEPA